MSILLSFTAPRVIPHSFNLLQWTSKGGKLQNFHNLVVFQDQRKVAQNKSRSKCFIQFLYRSVHLFIYLVLYNFFLYRPVYFILFYFVLYRPTCLIFLHLYSFYTLLNIYFLFIDSFIQTCTYMHTFFFYYLFIQTNCYCVDKYIKSNMVCKDASLLV